MPPDRVPAIAGDAMPDAPDAPELLDVEVHELAGVRVLVAHHRGGGLERPQPGEPALSQIARDGCGTHRQGVGDLRARPALPPPPRDPLPQLHLNQSWALGAPSGLGSKSCRLSW